MSRYIKHSFPPGSTDDVCKLQDVAEAGELALNGKLSNSTRSAVNFIDRGYCRECSITSVNDLSDKKFTITGTQNSVKISRELDGPNGNTVYSKEIFDTITSVTVNGAVDGVKVGSGLSGFLNLIPIDLESSVMGMEYSCTIVNSEETRKYTLYDMLDDIHANGYTYLQLKEGANGESGVSDLASVTPITGITSKFAAINQFFAYKAYLIFIDGSSSSDTLTHTTTVRFRQCGD